MSCHCVRDFSEKKKKCEESKKKAIDILFLTSLFFISKNLFIELERKYWRLGKSRTKKGTGAGKNRREKNEEKMRLLNFSSDELLLEIERENFCKEREWKKID